MGVSEGVIPDVICKYLHIWTNIAV